nr:MAG TPA: hypothetical protein [Caudoviricetes sp.]
MQHRNMILVSCRRMENRFQTSTFKRSLIHFWKSTISCKITV